MVIILYITADYRTNKISKPGYQFSSELTSELRKWGNEI